MTGFVPSLSPASAQWRSDEFGIGAREALAVAIDEHVEKPMAVLRACESAQICSQSSCAAGS
eukprot:1479523-Pyramimonas_sp.AAC.1